MMKPGTIVTASEILALQNKFQAKRAPAFAALAATWTGTDQGSEPKPFDFFDLVTKLKQRGCVMHATGSRVTCKPPPMATDIDFCVLVPENAFLFVLSEIMINAGFAAEGDTSKYKKPQKGEFVSMRRGEFNFIMCTDEAWYLRHKDATERLKRFNLHDKQDRIALFKWFVYKTKSWRALRILLTAAR